MKDNAGLDDSYRFPPYQYRDHQLLWNKKGVGRLPNISEREACVGIPVGYTRPCVCKQEQKGDSWNDIRLTLVGNSWQVESLRGWCISWLTSWASAARLRCRRLWTRSPQAKVVIYKAYLFDRLWACVDGCCLRLRDPYYVSCWAWFP